MISSCTSPDEGRSVPEQALSAKAKDAMIVKDLIDFIVIPRGSGRFKLLKRGALKSVFSLQ